MTDTHSHEMVTDVDDLRDDLAFERRELEASIEHDYSTTIVPLDHRRPMWHFMGLWTTFVAGFSYMALGFEIYGGGFSLAKTVFVTIVGYAIWGNEPDFWRYGKPRFAWPIPTYAFAIVWFLLFTMAGWMMAKLAGGTTNAFNFSVHYSLFGVFFLAFIIATISQFAINDGNYYESVNAGQNLIGNVPGWRRIYTCLIVAGGGTFAAYPVHDQCVNG